MYHYNDIIRTFNYLNKIRNQILFSTSTRTFVSNYDLHSN